MLLQKYCLQVLILPAFLFSHLTFAEVYKWIDENGNVVYGDKPETSDAKQVIIKQSPGKDKDLQQRLEKRQKLLDVMQEERENRLAEQEKQAEEERKQQETCDRLTAELRDMRNASYLYEKTDDPSNPVILTDEERLQEQQRYQRYIDDNC